MEWTVAIGVDTHKAAHIAVALDQLGRELGACEVEASELGYERFLRWAESLGAAIVDGERTT
jgi:transposase